MISDPVRIVDSQVGLLAGNTALTADGSGNLNVNLATRLDSTNDSVTAQSGITTPAIYNVTLTSANTEYSQALPNNTKCFEFRCRSAVDVRFAFVTGKVAAPTAPYMTLTGGDWYTSPILNQGTSPSTLYLASATAGVVACIIAWT